MGRDETRARKYMMKPGRADKTQEILMLLPMSIGFAIFVLYPIIWVIRWAWFEYDGYTTATFIGFENFIRAFTRDPRFWRSLGNTMYIAAIKLVIEIPLAMLLAAFLTSKIRGSAIFRVSYFLPSVLSVAVVGLIFSIMFSSYNGIVNALLRSLGFIRKNINFLGRRENAFFVIILVSLWTSFGLNMIYFIMGYQNIPKDLYECAAIDGANVVQQFLHITVPLVAPVLQLVIMLSFLGTLRMTDLILVLTNGAPGGTTEVVMTYIFKYFFQYGEAMTRTQFGYASALAVITAVILAVITLVYLRLSNRMKQIQG